MNYYYKSSVLYITYFVQLIKILVIKGVPHEGRLFVSKFYVPELCWRYDGWMWSSEVCDFYNRWWPLHEWNLTLITADCLTWTRTIIVNSCTCWQWFCNVQDITIINSFIFKCIFSFRINISILLCKFISQVDDKWTKLDPLITETSMNVNFKT